MTATTAIPVTDWLLNLPLYTPVDISEKVSPCVKALLTYTGIVDFYCPACQLDTPFQGQLSLETQNSMASELMAAKAFGFASSFWKQTRFSKELSCTRAGHKVTFHFQVEDDRHLLKVGQYPSIAAIHHGELLAYESVLGKQGLRDLHYADALNANSNSLGAYIYLRKLFESQLQAISLQAQAAGNHVPNHANTSISVMASSLKDYLPSYLVQHPDLYAVLDLPLISLTDEICLQHYQALKTAVLLLADATLATNTRLHREAEAEQALSGLN